MKEKKIKKIERMKLERMKLYVDLDEAIDKMLAYLNEHNILLVEKDLIGDVELPLIYQESLKFEMSDELKEYLE